MNTSAGRDQAKRPFTALAKIRRALCYAAPSADDEHGDRVDWLSKPAATVLTRSSDVSASPQGYLQSGALDFGVHPVEYELLERSEAARKHATAAHVLKPSQSMSKASMKRKAPSGFRTRSMSSSSDESSSLDISRGPSLSLGLDDLKSVEEGRV